MKLKKYTIVVIVIILSGIVLISFNNDQKDFEISKNLNIYFTLFQELNTFYVDEINPDNLIKKSINEMLKSLDPYTNYISEEEIEDFMFMTTGEYAGIGAVIGKQKDKIVISEPYEGFPAQKSGLKAGDILLEVEGKSTEDMTTDDVSNLLKGPANLPVLVKVQRYGINKPIEVEIVREKISIDAVQYYGMINESTAYIRLSNFTQNCSDDVRKALIEMKSLYDPEALILDLRSNPGGLLIEAVNIMNLFVNKGEVIVSTKGKVKQWDKVYKATSEPVDTTIKIAVLVNNNSASASEIIAGAMQDLDRGIIVGSRTYGKGLVQTTRDLSYNTKLKVTTAKYYIPSGRCIQTLDYTHRNEDGSVGNIPDSLISEFTTKYGRKVYDGGGIIPDIKVEGEQISNLGIELIRDFQIFDYATKYASENQSIAQPEDFYISDNIYNDFVSFVKEKDFKYESQTEEEFLNLLELAKMEKYYMIAEEEFDALEERLVPDLDKDLNEFKSEIKELLEDEIVSRYYYQKGAIRAAIKEDKGIEKTLEVLSGEELYAAYFKPGIIISAN